MSNLTRINHQVKLTKMEKELQKVVGEIDLREINFAEFMEEEWCDYSYSKTSKGVELFLPFFPSDNDIEYIKKNKNILSHDENATRLITNILITCIKLENFVSEFGKTLGKLKPSNLLDLALEAHQEKCNAHYKACLMDCHFERQKIKDASASRDKFLSNAFNECVETEKLKRQKIKELELIEEKNKLIKEKDKLISEGHRIKRQVESLKKNFDETVKKMQLNETKTKELRHELKKYKKYSEKKIKSLESEIAMNSSDNIRKNAEEILSRNRERIQELEKELSSKRNTRETATDFYGTRSPRKLDTVSVQQKRSLSVPPIRKNADCYVHEGEEIQNLEDFLHLNAINMTSIYI